MCVCRFFGLGCACICMSVLATLHLFVRLVLPRERKTAEAVRFEVHIDLRCAIVMRLYGVRVCGREPVTVNYVVNDSSLQTGSRMPLSYSCSYVVACRRSHLTQQRKSAGHSAASRFHSSGSAELCTPTKRSAERHSAFS